MNLFTRLLQKSKGERMNIVEKTLKEIHPYKRNAKKHPPEQVEQIAESIRAFGWQQPIVLDKNNAIVAGHGRYLAAVQLGLDKVPCKYVGDLTDDEIKAFRILDNRIAESEIDLDLELTEISDIDFDFDPFDLDVFSIDGIEEVNGYDRNNDDKEYFSVAFTFPTAQKERVMKFLKKNKQVITDQIIQKASD